MTTSQARASILATIRQAVNAENRTIEDLAGLEQRLRTPPTAPVPKHDGDVIDTFTAKVSANQIVLTRVDRLQALVDVVAELAAAQEQEASNDKWVEGLHVDISVAPALKHLDWPADWHINFGRGRMVEPIAVTLAIAGVSETGSLILQSGRDHPMTLNFLPETHVVALHVRDVVRRIEDVWARLKRSNDLGQRALSIISGGSRTADVGGIVVRPAHGPKTLHLVLIDD